MSIHVSPSSDNIVSRSPAAEIINAYPVGADRGRLTDAHDECAEPAPSKADALSVHLGHMGLVITISATGSGAPSSIHIVEGNAQSEGHDALCFQVSNRSTSADLGFFKSGAVNGPPEQKAAAESGDIVVQRLSQALDAAERSAEEFGGVYADALRLAIMTRMLTDGMWSRPAPLAEAPARPERVRTGLPKWRLKRVSQYVDEHLAETVSLADMATAAGLSRMHFAAQFRIAMGMRPHEFLLRRRIERAQMLLLTTRDALVEIALDVGFQTQAHFTTVFRRLVGDTPYRWRCANCVRN